MKVNITDDQVTFLKELVHELKTQPNAATAKPLLFSIHEDEYAYVEEVLNHTDDIVKVVVLQNDDCDEFNNIKELVAYVEDWYFDDNSDDDVADLLETVKSCQDIDDLQCAISEELRQSLDLSFMYRIKSHRQSARNNHVFFTKAAAVRFIESNKHNLKNPTIFINNAYRNPEVRYIHELIYSIVDQLGGTKNDKD